MTTTTTEQDIKHYAEDVFDAIKHRATIRQQIHEHSLKLAQLATNMALNTVQTLPDAEDVEEMNDPDTVHHFVNSGSDYTFVESITKKVFELANMLSNNTRVLNMAEQRIARSLKFAGEASKASTKVQHDFSRQIGKAVYIITVTEGTARLSIDGNDDPDGQGEND